MKTKPIWPIIIKHDEVHDVVYVSTCEDWLNDKALCQFPYSEHDLMIDSQGSVFGLEYHSDSKAVCFIPTTKAVSMENFSLILRKHLCTMNESCISKVSVASYTEGFEVIRQSLDDDK